MAKILMVSSEAAPFAKTGGMGDVLEGLPRALVRAGEEVAVALPLYRRVAVPEARLAYEGLRFSLGTHGYSANIFEQIEQGVRYLFVQIPELYDRDQFYAELDVDYPDNHLRFGALCHAAMGLARHLFMPEIIHCHDWQSALLPVLVEHPYRLHPAYLGIKTVLTIHNLGYQGIFESSALADLGLPDSLFHPRLFELDRKLNFLKAGLLSAGMLTTVSPRYAREIQTPEFGCGLDAVLRARSDTLVGILNGADYSTWNPATDELIVETFDQDDLSGKQACKRDLLAQAGLPPERLDRPVVAIVSRLAQQKGFDLLAQMSHELVAEDISIVVIGSGEQRFEEFFRWFASAYPDRVSAVIGYDEPSAHRIYAGADMVLMPSRYEPCGLTQTYSMRYGTLPLVHATGGLDDTVDENTGFKFRDETADNLLESLRDALRVYGTARWEEMVRAAMQRNFSWDAIAPEYIRLYKQLGSEEEFPASRRNAGNDA